MKKIIEILPEEFKKSVIQLKVLGIDNVAWRYKDCMQIIEYLAERNFFILGGDVYKYENEIISSTYDSWYTDKNNSIPRKNIIEFSKTKSLSYLKKYKDLNGDNFCYSLVVE